MKTIIYYTGLIRLIQKMHFKISLIVLHKQVLNYRKNINRNSGLSEAIRSSIKFIIQDAVLNINGQNNHNNSEMYESLVYKYNRPACVQSINREELGELAKYFKNRNTKAVFNSIEIRLEKSTVDHMHEAIRYARQGDERNAHMHADIASCSCEELSHFIDKEQYRDFVVQIKDSLESLKAVI